MPYPLPLTRTEAYLAYKAGVIQQSDLKPSLAVPRNGIDAWLAYWTGLAADYPKREDGTPHILQEEEAYIAYLCGVINEYPEKCLRRVGAYLRYIISARWGRPDQPLNREELYLSLIKTQFIPSGDPSSDIVIDGTAKAPFVDVKMYGDTAQQTYTGQNLYNVAQVSTGTYVTKDDDGWITITRDNASGSSTVYTNVWTSNLALETSTAYKIFIEVKEVSGTGSLFITSTNSTQGQFSSWQEKKLANMVAGQTYTVTPTTKSSFSGITQGLRTVLEQTAGQGGSVTFRLSVCASSTPTETFSYEPYVGGTPSPNPDYPQPIQTVTGRQVVKVEGKNLFDKNSAEVVNGYVRDKVNQFVIQDSNSNKTIILQVQPNRTYTVSKSAGDRFRLFTLPNKTTAPGNYGITNIVRGDNKATELTISTGEDEFLYIHATENASLLEPVLDTLQVELGSTATDYEPYSSNDYEINLVGKNLLNPNGSEWQQGYWTYGGGSLIASRGRVCQINKTPVYEETTFTFTTDINIAFRVDFWNLDGSASGQFVNWFDPTATSMTKTFTVPANMQYTITLGWKGGGILAPSDVASHALMLELGSTATDYAPYFTPIELCKLGDYQDYIWKDGEDWKVHKSTSKATFSDLNWQDYQIGSTGHYRIYSSGIAQTVLPPSANNVNFIGYCSIYTNKTSSRTYAREEGCSIQGDGYANTGTIFIYDAAYDYSGSATNWKTARGAGQIYFVLKTATDTVITDTTLIAQLEALVKGGAEEGTTYIKVNATDPNLPAKLYVEAPKYE